MRKVVITGAANGIGRATALACASQGFEVIAADKDEAGLHDLQGAAGDGALTTYTADFADAGTCKTFLGDVYQEHGPLYALVNNAGIYQGKAIADYSDEDIETVWAVNLRSLVYLSRSFSQLPAETDAVRSIVNIASVAGEVGSLDAMYGATKAGVIGLTKANAWNFAPSIRVNAVSPALIRNTAIYNRIPEHRSQEYQRQEILKHPIEPNGVADVILFLLSEQSRHLTGKVIAVDNGAYPR